MRTYAVVITPAARRDLRAMTAWITAAESGRAAAGYIKRIEAFCASSSGLRGTGIKTGQRRTGFQRRCLILFGVRESVGLIQRVVYGGRCPPSLQEGRS